MFEIKKRFTGEVIFRSETATDLRSAILEAQAARADLADADLADADLARADLAGAYLAGAYLARANLAGANLARADLADADLADADLADADLAGAYLAGANLADANLAGANLAGADLADADLADADLAGAYLAGARRVPASLADHKDPVEPYVRKSAPSAERRKERALRFRQRNPTVPVVEHLDTKILAAVTTGGTLEMGSWHGSDNVINDKGEACGTTHCRAGWAIHLAGKEGYALQDKYDEQTAGRMIYLASVGRVPHFFAPNSRALENIKQWAAEEQAEATAS